jgi:acetyltransferase
MTPNATRGATLSSALGARKVAVFGASATPGKMGYVLVQHLLGQGFEGELVLVNPRGGRAFGLPLEEAEAAAGSDLAVVVTPAAAAPGIVETCAVVGIPIAIVQAAGFAEVGETTLQQELARKAAAGGVRLIGPNCLGLFCAPARLNLTTLPSLPAGGVSFVSQSGGLALHVARRLSALGGGFDVLLSLGNKLDVGFAEALDTLAERARTESVLLYLERLDEGDELLDTIERVTASLPVVALVGGRTKAGQDAARSHTGSLLSRWDRAAGLLEDAGAVVADGLVAAVAAAAAGRRGARRPAGRVFVLVDGGGHSVLLADAVTRAGYYLEPPPPALTAELHTLTGRSANPLDLAGAADADPEVYGRALARIADAGAYDAVIIGGIFGGYVELFGAQLERAEGAAAAAIGRLAVAHGVPVVVQTAFAGSHSPPLAILRDHGVACVEWPEEAAAALSTRVVSASIGGGRETAAAAADATLGARTDRALAALRAAGVAEAVGDVVPRASLPTAGGGPYAVKLDGFPHKARSGAIRLDVAAEELAAVYDELARLAEAAGLAPRVRLAPMVPCERELLVTFWRDGAGGAGWVAGRGGGSVEERADVASGRLPRDERDVLRALARTSAGREVAERRPDLLARLPGLVLALAAAFRALPELTELECNPVGLSAAGPVVLDVLPIG